jgi:hypothetical protein
MPASLEPLLDRGDPDFMSSVPVRVQETNVFSTAGVANYRRSVP